MRDKMWLRIGIWWFTFMRWLCYQMTLAYIERGNKAEAEQWFKLKQRYNEYLGMCLAKQLSDKIKEFC